MQTAVVQLPDDPKLLKDILVETNAEVERLKQINRIQEEMIRLMRIEKYGRKSEKLSNDQLEFLDGEPSVQAEEIEKEVQNTQPLPKRKKRNPQPGRVELPDHLQRVEEIILCNDDQCQCSQCGGDTTVIGYEESEVLDVKPAEYFVRKIKREKRACPKCPEQGVKTAAAPKRIVEKGKLSDAIIIDSVLKKYRDHIPLFRQSAGLMADAGLDIARSVLCNNVMKVGDLCMAICRELKKDLFAGRYIQADETPVGVQDPETIGKNHRAFMWEYSRPFGPVVFDFQMGRSREGPIDFLKNFQGHLQSDGYSTYDCIKDPNIIHSRCLVHARRYFDKARLVASENPKPKEILEQIAKIYAVESQARQLGFNHDQRLQLRKEKSVDLMDQLKQMIITARQDALPADALSEACDYTLGQWEGLIKFLEHGHLEPDNNWCENAIRPIALGRKNWLHIGSETAGTKIAAIMSVLETCRRLGVNAREYLLDVLPGLNNRPTSDLPNLTPMAWKNRQA